MFGTCNAMMVNFWILESGTQIPDRNSAACKFRILEHVPPPSSHLGYYLLFKLTFWMVPTPLLASGEDSEAAHRPRHVGGSTQYVTCLHLCVMTWHLWLSLWTARRKVQYFRRDFLQRVLFYFFFPYKNAHPLCPSSPPGSVLGYSEGNEYCCHFLVYFTFFIFLTLSACQYLVCLLFPVLFCFVSPCLPHAPPKGPPLHAGASTEMIRWFLSFFLPVVDSNPTSFLGLVRLGLSV